MKKELHPHWSKQAQAAGERMRQSWEKFFSPTQKADEAPTRLLPGSAEGQKIAAALTQHEAALLRYPNVVGVADGIRARRGKPTGERCLVVYVERKIPKSKLNKGAILPRKINDIPVDVVEVGKVEPLPL